MFPRMIEARIQIEKPLRLPFDLGNWGDDALWRIEVMNAESEVSSRFAVESFKKIQDQYIVKRITLTDYSSRDRTTFEVKAAAVGISLNQKLFCPVSALSVDTSIPSLMKEL